MSGISWCWRRSDRRQIDAPKKGRVLLARGSPVPDVACGACIRLPPRIPVVSTNCCRAQPVLPWVPSCVYVRSCFCALILAMTLPGFTIALSVSAVGGNTPCITEKADIEKRMEVARSKGRRLLCRQIADQLATLQAVSKPLCRLKPCGDYGKAGKGSPRARDGVRSR